MDKSKSHWAYRPHDYNCQITEIRRYIEENEIPGWNVVSKRTADETSMMEYEIVKFDTEILYDSKKYRVLILEIRYYYDNDVDSIQRLYTDLKEIEDISKEIKIENTYDAIQLIEANSDKNLKIEKDRMLYSVNDFFQQCVGRKTAFIIRNFRLLPVEELIEMDASPYEPSIKTKDFLKEIKEEISIISSEISEDFDEYAKEAYFFLTFDNNEFHKVIAKINKNDIIFKCIP